MSYNLTEPQRELLVWIVEEIQAKNLSEEFTVMWVNDKGVLSKSDYRGSEHPTITKGMLDALSAERLLSCVPTQHRGREGNRNCSITQKAYDVVDSDFAAPDTSFITHLTPLADITSLDDEIKTRCLPILGAGSADPTLWDSAVRTAGVILEERLRDVGGITDSGRVGRDLVNDVFSNNGTLAGEFTLDAERQGYRDLYAGIVGAFRNPYAHRLVDPTPEDGGALMVFINLLLKRLEDCILSLESKDR